MGESAENRDGFREYDLVDKWECAFPAKTYLAYAGCDPPCSRENRSGSRSSSAACCLCQERHNLQFSFRSAWHGSRTPTVCASSLLPARQNTSKSPIAHSQLPLPGCATQSRGDRRALKNPQHAGHRFEVNLREWGVLRRRKTLIRGRQRFSPQLKMRSRRNARGRWYRTGFVP